MAVGRMTRMTRQRRIILEELQKLTSHPTADEVYDLVRLKLPRVSLGTIYRNLEVLSRTGAIQKLEASGSQRRYDATVTQHYHIRCNHCGRVDDVPLDPVIELEHALHDQCHYEVTGHWVEFAGVCPDCQKTQPGSKSAQAV